MEMLYKISLGKTGIEQIKKLIKPLLPEDHANHSFNQEVLNDLGWTTWAVNHTQIFDHDLDNLLRGLKQLEVEEFFVIQTLWLDRKSLHIPAYNFEVTKQDFIKIQLDRDLCKDLTFHECLIFSQPLSFAILRTGQIGKVIYAGPPKFINEVKKP